MTELKEKLENLPDKPGVYIMKNSAGQIIYVGKAISLKKRVRQYFKASGHDGKVGAMVSHINDIDYILTDSELEALILECNLIKEHKPKYNINLKDDKHYPYIKITMNEEFPRIMLTRELKKDKSRYFGPYGSAKAVRDTIQVIKKVFPVRTCTRSVREGEAKGRPCLSYYLNQCIGPCLGTVKRSDYMQIIDDVCRFLDGRHEDIVKDLNKNMKEASENLQFELAAVYRDRIIAVERVMEDQKIISTSMEDQDVIAMAREGNIAAIQVFYIRSGKLLSGEHFILEDEERSNESYIIESFLKQYYSIERYLPKEILIQHDIESIEIIEEWLSGLKGRKVRIISPKKGEKRKLIEMTERNAKEALVSHVRKIHHEEDRTTGALKELMSILSLEKYPYRMECFDNSNIQGTDPVASMVVFTNGKPDKKEYRRFRIKTVTGPDDYMSMAEVISRRFSRGLAEQEDLIEKNKDPDEGKFSKFPDLLVVDGGKGQLKAAISAMEKLGLYYIPIIALAKKNEEIYLKDQKNPIVLAKDSKALHLIQRLRDEAHRFAVTYHRSLRESNNLHSVLEDIPGIGPKRSKALLKAFGSVENISKASLEDLSKVEGMNIKAAEKILEYLGS